jgi:hypothetical protein
MAEDHRAFMEWTQGYERSTSEGTNTLECHEALLQAACCPVLRLSGPMHVGQALTRVLQTIGENYL